MSAQVSSWVYLMRLGVLALLFAAYQGSTDAQNFISMGIGFLQAKDFAGLRTFILSYGALAPITSIALMALQSLVPLVPGVLITISNAWIFGWQQGALYSWIGALIGACTDFGLSRWYGRPLVEQCVAPKYMDATDNFFKIHGVIAVFVTRLTPIIPFKVISYGCGLTDISLPHFVLATAIGQTPAIIIFSVLGQHMTENVYPMLFVSALMVILGLLIYSFRRHIERLFIYHKE